MPIATARDTLEALHAALDECLRHDLIVFSGGSSVGERDLILDVIRARGEMLFPRHRREAGQADARSDTSQGTPVFGMPGYPTSCLSNAYILLVPALRRMARLPLTAPRTVTLPLAARVDVGAGPSPVLHGSRRARAGGARLQGIGRHHVDVARRRLHRDSRPRSPRLSAGTPVTVTLF